MFTVVFTPYNQDSAEGEQSGDKNLSIPLTPLEKLKRKYDLQSDSSSPAKVSKFQDDMKSYLAIPEPIEDINDKDFDMLDWWHEHRRMLPLHFFLTNTVLDPTIFHLRYFPKVSTPLASTPRKTIPEFQYCYDLLI